MKKGAFRPFIMPLLIVLCTLFYYFGELVDWAAWDALRHSLLYGVHDIHRMLFLVPIIYAGYNARIRGAVIITLVSFAIFLPRAFFISPYPDPLLRTVIFTVFAGFIGVLVAITRNQCEKCRNLEQLMEKQRDKLQNIINGVADGIIITGPDYVIRFMNTAMINDFGDGTGIPCYRHLRKADAPCEHGCKIPDVISNGRAQRWICELPNGRQVEAFAAPYIDSDGTVCQVSIFRDISSTSG